jgi:hypothetical protein
MERQMAQKSNGTPCKFCNTPHLHWVEVGPEYWRLADGKGDLHICAVRKWEGEPMSDLGFWKYDARAGMYKNPSLVARLDQQYGVPGDGSDGEEQEFSCRVSLTDPRDIAFVIQDGLVAALQKRPPIHGSLSLCIGTDLADRSCVYAAWVPLRRGTKRDYD